MSVYKFAKVCNHVGTVKLRSAVVVLICIPVPIANVPINDLKELSRICQLNLLNK